MRERSFERNKGIPFCYESNLAKTNTRQIVVNEMRMNVKMTAIELPSTLMKAITNGIIPAEMFYMLFMTPQPIPFD